MIASGDAWLLIHLDWLIYLNGVSCRTEEYFTYKTSSSIMVGGYRVVPGEKPESWLKVLLSDLTFIWVAVLLSYVRKLRVPKP